MIILLSPAKKLDYDKPTPISAFSKPQFQKESRELIQELRTLNSEDIGSLMKLSAKLSDLNYHRYQDWSIPSRATSDARQAGYAFSGTVYQGLDFYSLSEKEVEYAQKHLRILSGLHGVLKPLDLIKPYRLEMGTKLAVGKTKNLYAFWGDKLVSELNKDLNGGLLLNLASNEYFKAAKPKKIVGTVVNFQFKDNKNGQYKTIMTYAKKARGLMARYIIQNQVDQLEDIKGFDSDGYMYNNHLSKPNDLVFTRG